MTWDVKLESNLAIWCMEYAKGLSYLEEISISRWTGCSKGIMELHGFCDASEKACAAAVYTKVRVTLLAAKSKERGKSQQPSHLTAEELKLAKIAVVEIQQQLDFGHEVRLLQNKRSLDPKSKLQAINPFLDSDGVIRVGGQLQNAMIPYNVKHPIILDRNCKECS